MTDLREILDSCADIWAAWVFPAAIQAAVLGLIVFVVVRLVRRASAHVRYALLLLVLAKFVMPPLADMPFGIASQFEFSSSQSGSRLTADDADGNNNLNGTNNEIATPPNEVSDSLSESSEPAELVPDSAVAIDSLQAAPGVRERLKAAGMDDRQDPGTLELAATSSIAMGQATRTKPVLSWLAVILVIHILGGLYVMFSALRATLGLRRLIRLGSRITPASQLAPDIRFVTSSSVSVPFSCGLLWKTVVLPESLTQHLNGAQLEAVLRHEIAHHRRGDLLVNWLQVLTTALWWFHPILWLINAEVRRVREECCDDRLLSRGEVTDELYSETLVAVARFSGRLSVSKSQPIPLTVSMADGRHPLAGRLERIMDLSLTRHPHLRASSWLMIAVAAALVLPGLSTNEMAASTQDSTQTGAAAPTETAFSGIVRDHNKNPVPDADVFLLVEDPWGIPKTKGQTKSLADGTFEFRLKDNDYHFTSMTEFNFIARKNGHGLGLTEHRGTKPEPQTEVMLPRSVSAKFVFQTPEGKPLANGKVSLVYAKFGKTSLQFPLAGLPDALVVRTNKSGIANIDGLAREAISGVKITTADYGTQGFTLFSKDGIPETLRLRPVGRITGQVVSQTDIDPTQLRISLGTYGARTDGGGTTVNRKGQAFIQPDKQGRFVVPAMATGSIRGAVYTPDGFKGWESLPQDLTVTNGAETKVKVLIRPTVKVRRRLQSSENGQAIANAYVGLQGQGVRRKVWTDSNGWFTAWLKPNAEYHTVYDVPHEYLRQPIGQSSTKVGGSETELPPLEFRRGKQITGVVVDAKGKPQNGVDVLADWTNPDSNMGEFAVDSVNAKAQATTNAKGKFTLYRVHPNVNATLIALRSGVRVAENVVVPESKNDAKIELSEQNFVSLSGQIENASVLNKGKQSQLRLYSNFSGSKSDRGRNFVSSIDVKPDGSFSTSPQYPDEYAYRLIVLVNNSEVATSKWIVPKEGSATFTPLIIPAETMGKRTVVKKRLRSDMPISIVDSQGQPIPNVPVVAWYLGNRRRMTADTTGSLTLPDVGDSGAWLFVDADGFRFHGEFVNRSENPVVQLVRTSEPDPQGPMRTLQTDKPSSELLEHAHTIHEETLRECLERADFQSFRKSRAVQFFARVAPQQADEFVKDSARDERVQIASLANVDLAQALKKIRKLPADQQLWAYANVLRRSRSLTLAQKQKVIGSAKPLISNAPEDLTHWASTMRANDMLDDSNRMFARALKLLPDSGASDRADFTRGFFAWNYAEIDYKKSLKLVEGISDKKAQRRFLTNIAHKLAKKNPQAAIEVLGMMENTDSVAFKLVSTMDASNGADARRLAFGIKDPRYRAHALAYVASSNPNGENAKDAKKLLRTAFDILIAETNDGDRAGLQVRKSFTTAIALLPLVERVAPEQLREYFWRALSLRRNISHGYESRLLGPHGEGRTLRYADPVLALALSRYDRSVARQIALDPEDETLDLAAEHGPFRLFAALAVLDPTAAIKTIEGLPTATERQLKSKLEACQQLAYVLTLNVREQWNSVIEDQYMLRDPTRLDF